MGRPIGKLAHAALFGFAATTAVFLSASSASAQETTTSDRGGGAEKAPVCMAKPRPANANVRESERGRPYHVVVAAGDQSRFEKRGFVVTECGESGREELADKEAYRDQACELAAFGNPAVQRQLTKSIGESPSALCASAQKAVGKWKSPKRSRPQGEPQTNQTQQNGSGE